MLAPRVVIFTPSDLLGSANSLAQPAAEALLEIERRHVPLVLSTRGTRAQLEPLRRKLEHAHPFITEGGGGLFFPDGYFALRLEGARRAARYLCVPFGRSSQEAGAAVEDIAREAGAEIVRYAEMSPREIARNTGMPERDAEAAREREFSERFFFAGDAGSAAQVVRKDSRRQWVADSALGALLGTLLRQRRRQSRPLSHAALSASAPIAYPVGRDWRILRGPLLVSGGRSSFPPADKRQPLRRSVAF